MKLLPLLLNEGKSTQIPIVIPGLKKINLHEIVYRNKKEQDLIIDCKLEVMGETLEYRRSETDDKTYFLNGKKGSWKSIDIGNRDTLDVTLYVNCKDFSKCNCQQHRFQLNLSAEIEN